MTEKNSVTGISTSSAISTLKNTRATTVSPVSSPLAASGKEARRGVTGEDDDQDGADIDQRGQDLAVQVAVDEQVQSLGNTNLVDRHPDNIICPAPAGYTQQSNRGKTIMKAIILSAGQGTRLLPLTAEIPKCAICHTRQDRARVADR